MYVEGEVIDVDNQNYKVRLRVTELDNFETPWLNIPQRYVVKNKTGFEVEKGSWAGAILSDDMTHGAYLGAFYNGVDTPLKDKAESDYVQFEDGTSIEHKKDSKKIIINADCLIVNGDISSTGNISDKKGSVQAIRDWNNSHEHSNGNNGSNTGTPVKKI